MNSTEDAPDPGCEAITAGGAVVRLRPVRPTDSDALRELNVRSSDQSLYLRFFGSSRTMADRYVDRLVRPSSEDHGVLVALLGDALVGVAGYERIADHEAEVALLVEDAHQGEGIGMLLLEHLASLARRHGVVRLVADTLAQNRRMLGVFGHSGLETDHVLRGGVVDVGLITTPDPSALDAIDERERRAETRSLRPMFRPRSIAVVGPGRGPGDTAYDVVRSLLRGGFAGPIFPIDPLSRTVAGVPAYATVGTVGAPIDLAVVAVPLAGVDDVVEQAASSGVRAVAVVSAYPRDVSDPATGPNRRSLLQTARRHGIRVVGPGCLGVVCTDPDVRVDTTITNQAAPPGVIALAAQGGASGIAVLERLTQLGAGVAAFVSLGDKIDISGNDLLLVWDRDPRVAVVALYLESLGNPRKFARLARRVARQKPVVLLTSMDEATPDAMIDIVCEQAGITRVRTVDELVEVATLLAAVPLPAGGRVGIATNDHSAVARIRPDADRAGLAVVDVRHGGGDATVGPDQVGPTVQGMVVSGDVDAVLAVFVAATPADVERPLRALAEVAKDSAVSVIPVLLGDAPGVRQLMGGERGGAPVFGTVESAVRALGHAVRYGRWLRTTAGRLIDIDRESADRASEMITGYLRGSPGGGSADSVWAGALLACYGIHAVPGFADDIETLHVSVDGDPSFGPILTMRTSGAGRDGRGSQASRAAPVTDAEARQMVLATRNESQEISPDRTLTVDVDPVEELLQRVGRLAANHPEIVELAVTTTREGPTSGLAAGVTLRLAPRTEAPDPDLRRLRA